jgi:hypothetical protein
LKAKSADGKLTPEERAEVREHAKKVFLEQFGIIGKFVSTLFMGSLEKWFETQKEYILNEIKKNHRRMYLNRRRPTDNNV